MNKWLAFIQAFRKGAIPADPAKWKNRAIVTAVVAFLTALVAVAKAFGIALEISDETLLGLAGGIFAGVELFHAVVHVTSSDKVGLPAKADGRAAEQKPGQSFLDD